MEIDKALTEMTLSFLSPEERLHLKYQSTEHEKYEVVVTTDLANTYGVVQLVRYFDTYYLQLDDCSGQDLEGPLTEKQVDAFYTLFDYLERP